MFGSLSQKVQFFFHLFDLKEIYLVTLSLLGLFLTLLY